MIETAACLGDATPGADAAMLALGSLFAIVLLLDAGLATLVVGRKAAAQSDGCE